MTILEAYREHKQLAKHFARLAIAEMRQGYPATWYRKQAHEHLHWALFIVR